MIRLVATRLMHIVDGITAEDGLRLLSLLLHRLPPAEVEQEVVTIGPPPPLLTMPPKVARHRLNRRFGWGLTWGMDVWRLTRARRPDLLHAWSMPAAALAGLGRPSPNRFSVTVSDPAEALTTSRWWHSLESASDGLIVCPSRLMQRRLIEAGIPPEATLVIRPGVDFGAIREAKQKMKCKDLALPAGARVLLAASPPSRAGGHFLAVWAMAILRQIWPDARMIVPGESREQQRLLRLADQIYCPDAFHFTANKYSISDLLAVADALVMPATEDISTGWLAWAMAASVPVIGSAVPSITEYIADRHNGLLCRPNEVHSLAARIRTAFDSPDLMRRCAETARGQAYDVFRAQGCIDQYLRLFRNLCASRPPAEGVRDTAVNA